MTQHVHPATPSTRDRWLVVAGIGCVAMSLFGIALDAADVVPPVAAVLLVLVPVGVGMQLLLGWAAKSASPQRRTRVLLVVSWTGLAVAGSTVVALLPTLTEAGGADTFIGDLLAHLWPLVWLAVVALSVHTLSYRTFAGLLLAGFLGVPALATLAGKPIVAGLGETPFTVAVLLPLIEEVLKALPVVVVVVLAARRRTNRPSATDPMLLGASIGAGFALYENALYGRGAEGVANLPPLSLLFPTVGTGEVNGFAMLGVGHLIWSALIGLGLGVGVLYRRYRLAWLAVPLTFAVAYGEHVVVNAIARTDEESVGALIGVGRVLLLYGWLSPLLLVGGTVAVVVLEWRRATRGTRGATRAARLATLQTGGRS